MFSKMNDCKSLVCMGGVIKMSTNDLLQKKKLHFHYNNRNKHKLESDVHTYVRRVWNE